MTSSGFCCIEHKTEIPENEFGINYCPYCATKRRLLGLGYSKQEVDDAMRELQVKQAYK